MDETAIRRLRERTIRRARPTGHETILPLYFGNQRIGTLTSENWKTLSAHPFNFSFRLEGDYVRLELGTRKLSSFLEELTETLINAGILLYQKDENLDVRPYGQDNVIAQAKRSIFRFLGFATISVHAMAITADGEWILAQRSQTKSVNPGKWDTLAAGLVSTAETTLEALKREILEEAGLTSAQYHLFPRFAYKQLVECTVQEGWLHETAFYYPIQLAPSVIPNNQDGEMIRFELCNRRALMRYVSKNLTTLESSLGILLFPAKAFRSAADEKLSFKNPPPKAIASNRCKQSLVDSMPKNRIR